MTTSPESFPEEPTVSIPPTSTPPTKIATSRVGYTWIGLIAGALVLILLLIFILQNLESAQVDFLFWSFSLPLGVGTLLAAIAGALIMAVVGGVRIVQLRREAKKLL